MEPSSIPHRMVVSFPGWQKLISQAASLSRDLQSHTSLPPLLQSLRESHGSILSLAANQDYIFSGNQNHDISVNSRFFPCDT